ncbi:MAG TPA: ROK family protein [Chitinophagaceae bacterium]|nr:ROK family protein [Chitinophagaceae bacterium]
MKYWGIDLGGTKIECAVLDENLETLTRKRIATEAFKGYPHIIAQVGRLVEQVAAELGEVPQKIGFATPGVLEPSTQRMKNCNTVCLNGQPMHYDLQEHLGIPVKLANDANCFALAETLMGAGKLYPDARVVFGVIMGTGVGGGLVVDGRVIEGRHGLGGEWGHNILEENGTDCYCGKKGCVEKVISGPALQDYYHSRSGQQRTLHEILQLHNTNADTHASATMERLVESYGKAVSVLVNIIDPDLIIIGGGVGNIDLLYTEGYERIKKYVFNEGRLTTPIIKPLLGDSAGVFGAALLYK